MPPNALSKVQDYRPKERLDLVEFVFDLYHYHNLENVVLIGAQHILPSFLTMLQSFFDRGLSPENVFIIGKCYSTDLRTYNQLSSLGVHICPSSLEFRKDLSFDSHYGSNIKSFTKRIVRNNLTKGQLVVVLDDGGELISYLNSCPERENFSLVGVEQTTSGYQKVKSLDLNISIINVARSYAKLQVESKIVAKTAVKEIFNRISSSAIQTKNILIFGNGAVGSALANAMGKKYNVSLTDINPEKADRPYEECLQNLPEFDLIIGCVGKTVLQLGEIQLLKKGTTLISLSSSDREFEILKLRNESRHIRSCHDDFESNGIKVLNCGFPVNFSGDAKRVDINEFELTRSLLTLGILQALELRSEKGLFSLNESDQMKLIHQFIKKYHGGLKTCE